MIKGPFVFAILCGLASISLAEPTKYEAPAKYEMPTTTPAPYAEKKEEYPMKMEPKKEEYPMKPQPQKEEYKKMEQPKKYKRSIGDAEEETGDAADDSTGSDPIWGYPYFGWGYRPFGYGRFWDNDPSITNDIDGSDVADAEEQAEPLKFCVGRFCVGSKRSDYARDPLRVCYRSKSGRRICVGSDEQEMDPIRACYRSKSGRRICVGSDEQEMDPIRACYTSRSGRRICVRNDGANQMDPIRVCYTTRTGRRICVGNDGQEMDPRMRCWLSPRGGMQCVGDQAKDPLCIKGPFGIKLCT